MNSNLGNFDLLTLSDTAIRELIKQHVYNGEYATKACKNCGAVWIHPYGDTKTAEIVNECGSCFKGN